MSRVTYRNIDLQSIFQIRLLKVVWTLIFFIFFLILPVSYIPENWFFQFSGKKTDKKESGDMLSGLDGSSGMQITEALKLQMEVQKRLHEQLEVCFTIPT
jgi:hypothetical protein